MRCRLYLVARAALMLEVSFVSAALGQGQAAKQGNRPRPANEKVVESPYREWLNEDVVYVIKREEKTAFLQLVNDVERDQFIEQFWRRRNPEPESFKNAFREEHYRRIAFANEHFATSFPGWQTDRGRVYVTFGPPDDVESHPKRGQYERLPEEGGGSTTRPPWERWVYRHIEGIGDDIELEFVDTDASDNYRLTMDPSDQNAMVNFGPPGALDCTSIPDGACALLFIGAQRAPQVKYKDLEAVVTSRIVRDQVAFGAQIDFLRATHDTTLVSISADIPDRSLHFSNKDGKLEARAQLFGRITKPSGWVVETFEDTLSREVLDSPAQLPAESFEAYQTEVPLRAGTYELALVVKDVDSRNIGVVRDNFEVPNYQDNQLGASTLVIGDQIDEEPSEEARPGQIVVGRYRVRPRLNREFKADEELGIVLQLYNVRVDAKSHQAKTSVACRIVKGQQEVWRLAESSERLHGPGEQITLMQRVPLQSLEPGKYRLEVEATDQISHQTILRAAAFTTR